MSRIQKGAALFLSIPTLFFVSVTAGFILFVSDKPVAADHEPGHNVAQQCNISLALDRSTSMDQQRRREAYQTVINLFNPSDARNNPGIGDERFRIGFTSFGTASTGYTGGNTPYFSAASGNSRPDTKYDNYYPSTNDNNGYGAPVWTPTDPNPTAYSRFQTRLNQLYQPARAGIIPMPNSSGNTNWEAGLSRNRSGTLPGNFRRASTFWWNQNGNWNTNNVGVGAGQVDYNLGLDQPGDADVIILITDGVPSLSAQYLVPQNGTATPPSADRVSDENAKAAGGAANYWRAQNRENGAGKKAVYGIMVGETDRNKNTYMNTAFGSTAGRNNWQTFDDFSQLDDSLRLDIIRLCAITWSTAGTTTLDTPRTTAPGQQVRWQHEIHRSSDNNWAIKAGQVFNYRTITYRLDGANRQDIASQNGSYRVGQPIRHSNPFIREQSTYDVGPSDYGKQICSYIEWTPSVESPNRAPDGENRSTPACTLVGKVPMINVLGGDIRAGAGAASGDVIGYSLRTNGNSFGSWAEYGVFGPGQVTTFASGGVLSKNLRSSSLQINRLTFANSPTSGAFMAPMDPRGTPITATFTATDQTLPGNWQNLSGTSYQIPSGAGVHRVRTNSALTIRINGQTNIRGVVMIDAPNATVVLAGNIGYSDGPFSSVSQIPLVLINAGAIRIEPNVSQVDAGLQTRFGISTCGAARNPYYSALNIDTCNQRLSLNGFVSAANLQLRRTAGAEGNGDAQAAPSETFNLRSDAILRINDLTKNNQTSIRTTSITELPPRL